MQITVVLLSLALIGPALSVVASTTASPHLTGETDAAEITAMILEHQAQSNRDNQQVKGVISKDGSVEFWSSGGLRQDVKNSMSLPDYASLNIMAKDIEVATATLLKVAIKEPGSFLREVEHESTSRSLRFGRHNQAQRLCRDHWQGERPSINAESVQNGHTTVAADGTSQTAE